MSEAQLTFEKAYKELVNTAYGLYVEAERVKKVIQAQMNSSGTREAAQSAFGDVREKLGDVIALVEAVDKTIDAEAGKPKPLRRRPSLRGSSAGTGTVVINSRDRGKKR